VPQQHATIAGHGALAFRALSVLADRTTRTNAFTILASLQNAPQQHATIAGHGAFAFRALSVLSNRAAPATIGDHHS
jgi:hypothetical protein